MHVSQVADAMLSLGERWTNEAEFCSAVAKYIKGVDERGIPGYNLRSF